MSIPSSTDLRERVMAAVADGMAITEAAHTFSVSRDAIHDWRHRLTATASVAPRPASGGRPRRLDGAAEAALAAHIDADPDRTIAERCAWRTEADGDTLPAATMRRTIARLDRPLKKRG